MTLGIATMTSSKTSPRARRITVIERLLLRMLLIDGQDHITLARRLGITPTGARLATRGFSPAVDVDPARPRDLLPMALENSRLKAITLDEIGVSPALSEFSRDRLWSSIVQAAHMTWVDDLAAGEREIEAQFDRMRAGGADLTAYEQEFATCLKAADLRPIVEAVAHV